MFIFRSKNCFSRCDKNPSSKLTPDCRAEILESLEGTCHNYNTRLYNATLLTKLHIHVLHVSVVRRQQGEQTVAGLAVFQSTPDSVQTPISLIYITNPNPNSERSDC